MDAASTRTLHTGRAMPVLGLGTWNLTHDTAHTVREALRLGYRMIDTSGDYGSQPGIGEAFRTSEVDREDIFLVAKVEEDEDAFASTRCNLDEMGRGHADLMLVHRPPPDGVGVSLWEGLIRARDEGMTHDIGVSNYTADQIDALVERTGEVPVVNQVEWTPFGWSADFLDYCRGKDILIQAYSPLTRAERLDDPRLGEIAAEVQQTPAQVLLRWHLQLGLVPLPKANQVPHLEENLGAFGFELDDEAMSRLSELNEHYSALGSLPYVQ